MERIRLSEPFLHRRSWAMTALKALGAAFIVLSILWLPGDGWSDDALPWSTFTALRGAVTGEPPQQVCADLPQSRHFYIPAAEDQTWFVLWWAGGPRWSLSLHGPGVVKRVWEGHRLQDDSLVVDHAGEPPPGTSPCPWLRSDPSGQAPSGVYRI